MGPMQSKPTKKMSFLHKAITMHLSLGSVGVFVCAHSLGALPTAVQEEGFQRSLFLVSLRYYGKI